MPTHSNLTINPVGTKTWAIRRSGLAIAHVVDLGNTWLLRVDGIDPKGKAAHPVARHLSILHGTKVADPESGFALVRERLESFRPGETGSTPSDSESGRKNHPKTRETTTTAPPARNVLEDNARTLIQRFAPEIRNLRERAAKAGIDPDVVKSYDRWIARAERAEQITEPRDLYRLLENLWDFHPDTEEVEQAIRLLGFGRTFETRFPHRRRNR